MSTSIKFASMTVITKPTVGTLEFQSKLLFKFFFHHLKIQALHTSIALRQNAQFCKVSLQDQAGAM